MKYWNRVKIISWFYEWLTWSVIEFDKDSLLYRVKWIIYTDTWIEMIDISWIKIEELEIIK